MAVMSWRFCCHCLPSCLLAFVYYFLFNFILQLLKVLLFSPACGVCTPMIDGLGKCYATDFGLHLIYEYPKVSHRVSINRLKRGSRWGFQFLLPTFLGTLARQAQKDDDAQVLISPVFN